MRTSLLYLFTVLCTLSFFTSCGDDEDDSKKNEGWKEISKTYKGATLKVAGAAAGDVAIAATSEKAATVTLTNVVPDAASMKIEAALASANGTMSISGENTVNGCLVKTAGTIDNKGVLTLNVTREITAPVVGDWKLKMETEGNVSVAQVLLAAKTGSPEIDGLLAAGGPLLGQMIGGKVSAVTSKLGKNGSFDVSWRKVGAAEDTGIPPAIAQMLNLQYCVVNNQLVLAFDKNMLTLAGSILQPMLDQYGLKMEQLTGLLVDLGGYYGFPVNMKIDGDTATFFVSKEQIVPLLAVAGPILTPIIPKELQELVGTILKLIPTAQQFDLGLVFGK